MNVSGTQMNSSPFLKRLQAIRLGRGAAFGIIIVVALLAFEAFNFSTTDYALNDVLGDLKFAGIRWATILTLAFCGIDFAGIARLFTPEKGHGEPSEAWYLFGAWLLAATMNAILTWWGVSIAIANHPMESTSVVDASTMITVVPVFVAIMVWLIRILIIGSLSYAGDRLFSQSDRPHPSMRPAHSIPAAHPAPASVSAAPGPAASQPSYPSRPAPKPVSLPEASFNRPEPTYQHISTASRPVHPVRPEASPNRPAPTRR